MIEISYELLKHIFKLALMYSVLSFVAAWITGILVIIAQYLFPPKE